MDIFRHPPGVGVSPETRTYVRTHKIMNKI
nr:MAG TPA: hypothetical protein [Caudoviricetes sp.]